MSRSSGDAERFGTGERAAVEPIAALVAVVAVGAALGLYTVAIDDATPDRERDLASTALDGVERDATVGGVVDPERLDVTTLETTTGVAVELTTGDETWRATTGTDAPSIDANGYPGLDAKGYPGLDVAERPVTVRIAPGENVRGVLRVAVYE